MLNSLGEVLVGTRLPRGAAARFGERGVHDAGHSVRVAVVRRNLQRRGRRVERVLGAILPHEERGELGAHVGRCGIERQRAFVRRDRAVDIIAGREMPTEHELVIGLGRLGQRPLTRFRKRRGHASDDEEDQDFHTT